MDEGCSPVIRGEITARIQWGESLARVVADALQGLRGGCRRRAGLGCTRRIAGVGVDHHPARGGGDRATGAVRALRAAVAGGERPG